VGPRNHVLDAGRDPHVKDIFPQDVTCTENGLIKSSRKIKNDNSSTAESELWRNAGPSAFQLQETMLKSNKI